MRWDALKIGDVLVALRNDRPDDDLCMYLVLAVSIAPSEEKRYDTYLRLVDLTTSQLTVWECPTYVGRAYAVLRGINVIKSIDCFNSESE